VHFTPLNYLTGCYNAYRNYSLYVSYFVTERIAWSMVYGAKSKGQWFTLT